MVKASPNRKNVSLSTQIRRPNMYGNQSYEDIIKPIAEKLKEQREEYPMTIIYMQLAYCGYGYRLFNSIIKNQYVNELHSPRTRLFAQFHAQSTDKMKEDILEEIKKSSSNIRVIFATTALGMGVDAPNITRIIHIRPPSSLEAYVQEIGRAGRNGKQSYATLYYNNSDLSSPIIQPSMKEYCKTETCLRVSLLKYFGFTNEKQNKCCDNCEKVSKAVDPIPVCFRNVDSVDKIELTKDLSSLQNEVERDLVDHFGDGFTLTVKCINDIVEQIEFIASEKDLLNTFGIWDEEFSKKVYDVITHHAPLHSS